MAKWSFEFTDKAFAPQGEVINLKAAKVSLPLNKPNAASVTIRLDNPLAPFIAVQSLVEPIYLKAYRNGSLLFFGPVMTVQETGDESQNASLQINAVGPEFIWNFFFPWSSVNPFRQASGTSRAVRFKEQAARLDAGVASYLESHIDTTTGPISSSNTEELEITAFRTLMDILGEISNSVAGFDWQVYPQEAASLKIGKLVIKDIIGEQKPGAVFEWGGGRNNIANFNRTADISQMANLIYNVSSAGPEAPGAPTVNSEWGAGPYFALAQIWGERQAQMPLSVLNNTMRQKYVDEAVAIRSKPRQTISFQPVVDAGLGRVPALGADYEVGDSVRARILYQKTVHWDVFARVWGIDYAVDENNREVQTLTLSDS